MKLLLDTVILETLTYSYGKTVLFEDDLKTLSSLGKKSKVNWTKGFSLCLLIIINRHTEFFKVMEIVRKLAVPAQF